MRHSREWRAEAGTLLLCLVALAGSGLADRVFMSRRGPFVIAAVIGLALAIKWLRREAGPLSSGEDQTKGGSGIREGRDTGIDRS
jgi:hypothetical protein